MTQQANQVSPQYKSSPSTFSANMDANSRWDETSLVANQQGESLNELNDASSSPTIKEANVYESYPLENTTSQAAYISFEKAKIPPYCYYPVLPK